MFRAHTREESVEAYGDLMVHRGPIESIFSAAIGDYAYVLRSPDLSPLKEAAAFILDRR